MASRSRNASGRPRKRTSLALIEAAERLFGLHGIDSVSLRQIRLEAGAGNNSAISYHFNDREKLVNAIWEYRLPHLDAERRKLLNEMAVQGTEGDAHAVLRALVLPNYELKDSQGVHRYTAFFRHALRWRRGTAIRNEKLRLTPASQDALALYHALDPSIPNELMDYRLRHGSCLFCDMVAERDGDIAEGLSVVPEQHFLDECIDLLRAICLKAPP